MCVYVFVCMCVCVCVYVCVCGGGGIGLVYKGVSITKLCNYNYVQGFAMDEWILMT